jgi:hypothetical protein
LFTPFTLGSAKTQYNHAVYLLDVSRERAHVL